MDGSHVGNPKENERKCQMEGCDELSIGGRGVLCRKHRNKTYKQNYKKKKRKAAGLEDGDGGKVGNHVADKRYVLEQKYSSMLQQILVQKRLELLSTEPVAKFIQEHQQKVSQQKKKESEERKARGCRAAAEKDSPRDQKPVLPVTKAELKSQSSIQAQSRNTPVCSFNTSQAQQVHQSVSVQQEQRPIQTTQKTVVKQNSVADSQVIQRQLIQITSPNMSNSASIQTVSTSPTSYPLKIQNNTSIPQYTNTQQRTILPGRPLAPLPATTQPETSPEKTLIANQSMLVPRPVFYTSLNPNSVLINQKFTPMNSNNNLQFITPGSTSPAMSSPPILHPSVVSSTLQSIALSNNAVSGNLVGGSPAAVLNQSSASLPNTATLPHVTMYNSVISTSEGLPESKNVIPVSHQTSQPQLNQGHINQEQVHQSQPFHSIISPPLLGMSKQQGNMLWQYPLPGSGSMQEDVLLQVLQGAKGDHLVPGSAFTDIDMDAMTSHCASLINDGPWPVSVDI